MVAAVLMCIHVQDVTRVNTSIIHVLLYPSSGERLGLQTPLDLPGQCFLLVIINAAQIHCTTLLAKDMV